MTYIMLPKLLAIPITKSFSFTSRSNVSVFEIIGISSTDSGMDSPSDHSISLFDYLTLEHPPFGKPMDDLHLDYLYDRLSTYSVDMMIHKLDRVNKLGDDVLSIESKLLEVCYVLLWFVPQLL